MSGSKRQQLLAAQEYMREHLPFFVNSDFTRCNAHKLYGWQRDYLLVGILDPVNDPKLQMVTAANQIGKSSIQIIRCINMACRQDLWPRWFPKKAPKTFFYCYPESKLATVEFREKWEKVYLSRGEMKDDPRYGWKAHFGDKGQIDSIVFNSGVTVYIRCYSQSPTVLQASTLDACFMDEEPPAEHFDELSVRCQAMQASGAGHISIVFTATLGQQWLYQAMEMRGTEQETLKTAWKRQISVFDCIKYADGSPSEIWSDDYINNVLRPKFRSEKEIARRLMGRFVKESGLVYQEFETGRNCEEPGVTDVTGWRSYVGIDYGSGGDFGHSSAIVHVKVDPTYSKARVISVWTSQKRRMTQSDLLLRYKEMAPSFGVHQAFADWGAVDLFTLAAREGVRFEKAEKSHEIGVNLLNTLFKEAQLKIVMHPGSHANHLVQELQTISEDKNKRHRIDDCADALRYALSLCPMRLTALKVHEEKKKADISKLNPRYVFYKGLDRRGDPMREDDDDLGDDLMDAIDEFEGLL